MTAFHYACKFGPPHIAKMLIQKSTMFNINLKAFENNGRTAFHLACFDDRKIIVEMMIENAETLEIDLTAKDKEGKTGFQLAERKGNQDVVNIIERKMTKLNLNDFKDKKSISSDFCISC